MKLGLSARLVAAALLALGASAHAADSQNLQVNATVSGVCKLTAVPAMSFTIDPSTTTNATATSTVQYKCTKNVVTTGFTVGGGTSGTATVNLAGQTSGNTDVLPVGISWTNPAAFTGTGFGSGSTANSVTLTGTITPANFGNVRADTYANTVTIAVNP